VPQSPRAASALLHTPVPELGPSDFLSLAEARQHEAVAAAEVIGIDPAGLVFLGYPDAGLAGICAASSGDPVASTFTGMTSTYGPAQTDYHTQAHTRPGLYTRREIAADVEEILRHSQPASVYVTDGADDHPDHKAAFALVHDAAAAAGYAGTLFTFVAHSSQWTVDRQYLESFVQSEEVFWTER
jgi:LmbE family N-acetylglucosaminyl deacetylase